MSCHQRHVLNTPSLLYAHNRNLKIITRDKSEGAVIKLRTHQGCWPYKHVMFIAHYDVGEHIYAWPEDFLRFVSVPGSQSIPRKRGWIRWKAPSHYVSPRFSSFFFLGCFEDLVIKRRKKQTCIPIFVVISLITCCFQCLIISFLKVRGCYVNNKMCSGMETWITWSVAFLFFSVMWWRRKRIFI